MNHHKLATKFSRAEDSPGLLLWQLSNRWQSEQRAALKPFHLTHVQFVLLASLTFAVGKRNFTQKQLADYSEMDVMMTSQVVRKLEQKGLIERKQNTHDTRAILLKPTAAGIALANKAVVVVEEVDRKFFSPVDNNLTTFTKTLRHIITPDSIQ